MARMQGHYRITPQKLRHRTSNDHRSKHDDLEIPTPMVHGRSQSLHPPCDIKGHPDRSLSIANGPSRPRCSHAPNKPVHQARERLGSLFRHFLVIKERHRCGYLGRSWAGRVVETSEPNRWDKVSSTFYESSGDDEGVGIDEWGNYIDSFRFL